MRSLFEAAGAAHELHVLDVPDAVCLARLRRRDAKGHPYGVSDADFAELTSCLEPPTGTEGFATIIHR